MKLIDLVVCFTLSVCLMPSAIAAEETASDQTYVPPVASETDRMELLAFMEEARNFALSNGTEEALKSFSDPSGKFVKGEMYVFAYDFNGTLLAHPYPHNLIGRNNLDLVDPNGVHYIKNLMEIAKSGQGFALTCRIAKDGAGSPHPSGWG